jgi:hypothetical protein
MNHEDKGQCKKTRGGLVEGKSVGFGIRLGLVVILVMVGLTVGVKVVRANEGMYYLENVRGGEAKCVAMSVLVDTSFQIVVTCRQLIFPPEPPNIQRYILWAEGEELRRPTKLGEIKRGKLYVRTNKRFDVLSITAEEKSVNRPTGPQMMVGVREPIDFRLTPTPTPDWSLYPTPTSMEATDSAEEATKSARRGILQSTGGKILVIVLSGFVIFAVIVAIFTRKA